jgi:hypothetical protein
MALFSVVVSKNVKQFVSATIEVEATDAKSAEALALAQYHEEGFDLYPEGALYDDDDDSLDASARLVGE